MALYAGRLQLTNWTDGLIGQASLERSILNQRHGYLRVLLFHFPVTAVFERLLAGQCLSSKRGQIARTFLMVTNIQKRIYLPGLHKQNVRLALAQQSGHCASRRLAPIAVGI
ncbi:hypothetical protein T02_783 [Trichinella nativa]|uniref:Uncharacterized protein n=2 Tax=Trichinella TaxID=6333 RepID=A0A0V1LVJ8_9BILA|nr:hypothetical protein T09_15275 [Trichinella sp. T9]KRX80938.1 hypothetical protein T06_5720 [Trichinella sp. T6]KRY19894.1 hypothetical protein T12_13073 [Trichinella patagoniensis]KRZ63441.1 hypothetical protein T02_783 [Trichinella nativa]